MRQYKIEDKKLLQILETRGEVFEESKKVNMIIVEADKERTKLSYKMENLKNKTQKLMDKHNAKFNLDEYEEISSVKLEKGEVIVDIYDKIEEYKKMLKEKNNNK